MVVKPHLSLDLLNFFIVGFDRLGEVSAVVLTFIIQTIKIMLLT